MRKILGNKIQYYVQTNNAQVELFKDYFKKGLPIACGPTVAAMGFDISGCPMDVFTPGEQPEDSILMVANNPKNLDKLRQVRDIDYDMYPPHEVPQIYNIIGQLIYDKEVCRFEWGLDFDIIKSNIKNQTVMMICGKFPAGGHYVLVVGFDDEKRKIIYNDPYPDQWPDKNGYNREMDLEFLDNKIEKWRIDFFPFNQ